MQTKNDDIQKLKQQLENAQQTVRQTVSTNVVNIPAPEGTDAEK